MEQNSDVNHLPAFIQSTNHQVWIQAIGRALYQAGYGIIQFYIPLIFVQQIGLSATAVGLGMGSGSLAGVLGHLLGGYLADSPQYGRKRTLLFAAGLSILAALLLTQTQNLPMLVVANLLLGLSAGCYWTAADAAVIDVTAPEQRQQAFAILVLADNIGGGLGILGGGVLLAMAPQARLLFLSTSLIFLVFLVLIQTTAVETQQDKAEHTAPLKGFVVALRDRSLLLFVLVNILFTTYIALVNSTLPLYLTKLMSARALNAAGGGSSVVSVANLFTWCYVGIGGVLQLPIVQMLKTVSKVRVLMMSMLLWSVGFASVWAIEMAPSIPLISTIAALALLSIATAIYKPFAPAIVAELAPISLRGIYLAISYQCWSIGYFMGPIVGGWAMDQPPSIAHNTWIIAATSTICGIVILLFLNHQNSPRNSLNSTQTQEDPASIT